MFKPKSFLIDGVEYVSAQQAGWDIGCSYSHLRAMAKKAGVEPIVVRAAMFKRSDMDRLGASMTADPHRSATP